MNQLFGLQHRSRTDPITQNFLSLSHFFPRYAGISHTSILISLPISIIVELKTK